ncbi:hypothetical protein NQ315_007002 [Exocentrus adspersus]|uniref:MD-2-related lipid-recognition domain-containing protein n=1 Tax=Exocentrus adspersus TaxID=1586481 RepID=A0AAV8WCB8_9CUCU|nr:hypothetical protein NQ315_007002 [Exocentrus adspersus]
MGVQLVLVVLGCMVALVTPINYDDCGGNGFVVNSVDVQGCSDDSTCRIPVGETRTVTVRSVNEVTGFSSLQSKAYIILMGHSWELPVTPNDVCLHWGCPLSDYSTRTYSANVHFNDTLLRRPGQLMLTVKYVTGEDEKVAFCVRFPVDLQ